MESIDELLKVFKKPLSETKEVKKKALKIEKEMKKIMKSFKIEDLADGLDIETFEEKKRPGWDKIKDTLQEAARPLSNAAQMLQDNRNELIKLLKSKKGSI